MSLINDALKRARETQPPNPPDGAPPLPPVEPPPRNGPGWMFPLALIMALLVVACIFMGVALLKRQPEPVVAKTAEPPAPPPPLTAQPVQLASAKPAPPAPASTQPPPAAPAVTNSTPATNAAPPKLKVQGIIFDPKHPMAIVNGKPVGVGESIGGFRVKAILPDSIQLQSPDGSQQTLKAGE